MQMIHSFLDARITLQPRVTFQIVFTEALTHGTKPWRGRQQRRTLLYRYAEGHINNFSSVSAADPQV